MAKVDQLSVALLLSDLNEVKEICAIFRKLNIIPHFYEDLKTFWQATEDDMPALCIVDVKMMSTKDLSLHDHPAVKNEIMPLAFYYTNNTEPLLLSTYDFFHLGLIKKADHYEGQLRALLKRVNHNIRLTKENEVLKKDRKDLSIQVEKIENEKIRNEQIELFQYMVKSVCLKLEEVRGEGDFFKSLEKVLQSVEEIEEFSMLELSFNGQKLMSPLSHVAKFRNIPSMWLGQTCSNGIETFAQNMATQVALDILGADIISILIKGDNARPEKLLFIKTNNEIFYNHFDWNLFEAYLNGFYSTYKNKIDRSPIDQKKLLSTYEAMSFLDQFLFGADKSTNIYKANSKNLDYRLINLDLYSLNQFILKKSNNRFFWNKFEREFINKLELASKVDFKFFEFGVLHLAFIVEARKADHFFDTLKDFSSKFSYWKYFDDSESMLSKIIQPKVKMIPLSAFAYLKETIANNIELTHSDLNLNAKSLDEAELKWQREEDLSLVREFIHEV